MVKKEAGKKDEKNQAKDAFGPVLVESCQAGTIVLMMESSEEEVVIKATEALYKFSEKCDANKLLLLNLDTVPRILKLLASETKVIQRNACLVLGSLSKHPKVTKALKQLNIIPMLLKLLGPHEEAVVNEFAALTLLSLANYYSCKRVIFENKGVEPLIRCLSSQDADVQKNSIDIISLILQEFEAKRLIREVNGITPIIELLKSEYAEIQCQALVALQLITEDVSNRKVVRDAGVVTELVNIVASQSLRDLHVSCLRVIANLCEDFETLQLMKDNGTLKQLMAVTLGEPLIVEEKKIKGGKEKDKAPSSTKGKKNVDDDVKPVSTSSIHVLLSPETKAQVAWTFQRAAKNGESRKLLNEQELEKLLIFLVSCSHHQVQAAASHAIAAMAEYVLSRDSLGKLGGIGPLVKILSVDESMELQTAAICALSVLSTSNTSNCQHIMSSEGLEPVIALLSTRCETAIDHALSVLTNIGFEDQFRDEILSCGVIPALVVLLSSESERIQEKTLSTLNCFVVGPSDRNEFVTCSGVDLLVDLLGSSNRDVQTSATCLLASLTEDEQTATVFCHRGALDILRHMQVSIENNAYVDIAIQKLLNLNMSAKYALNGRLNSTDTITDGFYDVGRLKAGKPFMPLLWYANEPINTRRPVLFVNTRCDDEEAQPDNQLIQMIEEAREMLQPMQFCSDAERATALAQYVSSQMGGPIKKGHFAGFSWELHISQLKYTLRSNIIPIGMVKSGIHYHRALLFKVMGDRLGIKSSLIRGELNHTWNELQLSDESVGGTRSGKLTRAWYA